jgi:hypothetical protein
MTSNRQKVQDYIERTYLPGELFTVYQIATALNLWEPKDERETAPHTEPLGEHKIAPKAEWPIRKMLDEGLLWRFVDVEWRDAQDVKRDDEPHARRYVRFALAKPPPARDKRTKQGSASVKERFGL